MKNSPRYILYGVLICGTLTCSTFALSQSANLTEQYQNSINGFANWDPYYGEFYVEQDGIVANALQEALVQDYDGLIRIAPAVPPEWDFDGSVYVRGNTKVDVQVKHGVVTTLVIEAGTTQYLKIRNPWSNAEIDIVSNSGARIVKKISGSTVLFHADAGKNYLIKRADMPAMDSRFIPVTDISAPSAKKLGSVQIGLFRKGQ